MSVYTEPSIAVEPGMRFVAKRRYAYSTLQHDGEILAGEHVTAKDTPFNTGLFFIEEHPYYLWALADENYWSPEPTP